MLDKNSPFGMPTAPRRGENLSSLALSLLSDAIVAGCPAPGAMVSELDLSARFAVGLAATRTALARLAAQGWVSAQGRRGWRVLPVSGEHLADLQAARDCLERVLPDNRPPAPLRAELRKRAQLHKAALHRLNADTLFHQERSLLTLSAQVMAAPRLRAWLIDSWDLSLRADRFLDMRFGIDRAPLPLADLAEALAQGDAGRAHDLLGAMRRDFADRCARALSRSDVQIAPPPKAAHTSTTSPRTAPAPDGTTSRNAQHGEPK
ncbi:GntR family transcriptional regulator [Roseinatronobacter sp. NSM]|uniref:GntR family transcriptional regulator n=1 Tax=Roseinatronobacter sp. NSM TaxID=3457785 RepID=UPI00403746B9